MSHRNADGTVAAPPSRLKPGNHRAEPVRSVVEPSRLDRAEPSQAEPAGRAGSAEGTKPSQAAPDPDRRGLAYWLEEISGVVPLAAPLLLEAVIHARFAEHFLDMGPWLAWLLPASLGLGAIRTAFYLDRARLRGDPTTLIRVGLYGYMVAGFVLSYWFLTSVPAEGATKVLDGAEVPAVVAGLFQAAGVFLWELRTRQRRREVERARHEVDEDRLRRALAFPIWSRRMRRWRVATGQRDMRVVVEAFAPLIVASMAGQPVARYPELAEPSRAKPARPSRATEPSRAEPPSQAKPARASQTEPGRVMPIASHRAEDEKRLARLLEQYPPTKPMPSRRELGTWLGVGSTVAGRLRARLEAARAEPSQAVEPDEAEPLLDRIASHRP